MREMTNQEIIEAVRRWQGSGLVHPLTCGNESRHGNLAPVEFERTVVLICPACDYQQRTIPQIVLKMRPDQAALPKWWRPG